MRIFKLKSFRVLSNYSLKFYSSFQQEGQGGGGGISVTLVYRAFPHLKLTLHFSSSVRHQICVDQSRFHIVLFSLFFLFFPMGTSGNLSGLPFLYRICPCEWGWDVKREVGTDGQKKKPPSVLLRSPLFFILLECVEWFEMSRSLIWWKEFPLHMQARYRRRIVDWDWSFIYFTLFFLFCAPKVLFWMVCQDFTWFFFSCLPQHFDWCSLTCCKVSVL